MKTKTKDKYKFTIQTKVTPAVYRNYAKFDTFVLRKRWIFPVFILACMLALAGTFYMTRMNFLAVFSALIGIVFFVVYFRTFFRIINDNTRHAPYDAVIDTYIVSLSEDGVEVYSQQEQAESSWADLRAAYLLSDCIALELNKERTFLITEPNPKQFAAIWEYICQCAGKKAKDRRSSIS